MGAIGGLLGLGGGASGTGYNVTPGTNAGQLGTAYGGAQNSLQSQQALLAALQGQNGLGNQSQVYNQLQGVANGTGPNPAQAMLNNATGQNIANQAALMAGQRGSSANAGLLARQAAQQGAGIQQNAVGQGAALQAQQSLGALGQAGSLANTMAGQQIGQTNTNNQAQQSEQQILQNANSQANAVNGQLAGNTQQGQQGLLGGILGGIGTAIGLADGGTVGAPTLGVNTTLPAPQSSLGQFLQGWPGSNPSPAMSEKTPQNGPGALQKGASQFVGGMADAFSRGGNVGQKLKAGGDVPGTSPVAGNSTKNDTVKALLSPGELVVDRETMADKGPAGDAARFLAAVIAAKKKGKK